MEQPVHRELFNRSSESIALFNELLFTQEEHLLPPSGNRHHEGHISSTVQHLPARLRRLHLFRHANSHGVDPLRGENSFAQRGGETGRNRGSCALVHQHHVHARFHWLLLPENHRKQSPQSFDKIRYRSFRYSNKITIEFPMI